jgi:hypothetical protein
MAESFLFKHHLPFWILAISIIIFLTLPVLIQDGMFMDALLYSSVSHNLSNGFGTFWFPRFSVINFAGSLTFHEQPPLFFGIQSVFYDLFGDSMYVERFYALLTIFFSSLLICKIWKENITDETNSKKFAWLPLILWITIPVCFWSYSNNMIENTMGIFTLLSFLFILKALQSEKIKIQYILLAGIFVFLATFTKGIPGFFPIAIPFIYWIITNKIKFSRAVTISFMIFLIPVLIYAILICFPQCRVSLSMYFFDRALHRMGQDPTVSNRFYILYRLFTELLPQIIFVIIILLIAKIKKTKTYISRNKRLSLFYFTVGLSASLPLLITLVQKGFYFVPSLPFFAISFSIIILPVIIQWFEKINIQNKSFKIFTIFSIIVLIFVVGFTISKIGKSSRDIEKLHDVYLIGNIVPKNSSISITDKIWPDWSLQCYLMRYFQISVTPGEYHKFFLSNIHERLDSNLHYKKMNLQTNMYNLYMKP